VLDWTGLRGEPPETFHEAWQNVLRHRPHRRPPRPAGRHRRRRRVATEGARIPLNDELIAELTRPTGLGEDPITRQRCAHLLGINPPRTAPPVTAADAARRTQRQFSGCSTRSANASRMITSQSMSCSRPRECRPIAAAQHGPRCSAGSASRYGARPPLPGDAIPPCC